MKCHAGCEVSAVLAAIGLKMSDLFPSKDGTAPIRNGQPKPSGPTFPTANDAVASLERQHGKRSAIWTYHDANGKPVALVIRWDKPGGKEIRPVSLHADGWRIAAMPGQRPLYRLPELAAAKRVIGCEGEKAADAARALGFVATTSAGGAQAASKTDWSPLAGKEVWLLPDNDAPGRKYGDNVAGILAKLTPAPVVRVLNLADHTPGLPDGGDLADVLADEHWCGLPLGDAADRVDLAALIEQLTEAVEPWRAVQTEDLTFRPFPVDALPEPIRGFVLAGAKSIGCDPSFLALPLVTALASAIGNTRSLELKRGWYAPPIIWGAIVGESGTAKTPPFRLVMRPIRERQPKALKRHEQEMEQYDADYVRWEKDMAAWKRQKHATDDPPPQTDRAPT
jgi:hypothetical protein